MKDPRGLDISANDPSAVAAADDFAARLLRLDQGVEGILESAKRWARHADHSTVCCGVLALRPNRRRPRDRRGPSTCVWSARDERAGARIADAAAYFDRNTQTKSLTPLDRVLANW